MEADDEALKVRERQEVKVKVQRSLQEAALPPGGPGDSEEGRAAQRWAPHPAAWMLNHPEAQRGTEPVAYLATPAPPKGATGPRWQDLDVWGDLEEALQRRNPQGRGPAIQALAGGAPGPGAQDPPTHV